MFRQKTDEAPAFWIATSETPTSPTHTFYQKLDAALAACQFGAEVRRLAVPFYEMDASKGGQPGIDPEVYCKMLMVGFFENLASERAMAARCADSLAIGAFLHYGLTERTPEHSTLSVIRQRLDSEVFDAVFALVLRALKGRKLLKGKRLAIDTSVLELLQESGIRTAIADPVAQRRVAQLTVEAHRAWQRARRTTRSKGGTALMRRRGESYERSFVPVLDYGGARRTTLRGWENIRKRYVIQAACANLAWLLRHVVGIGTLKQTWAASAAALEAVVRALQAVMRWSRPSGALRWLATARTRPPRAPRPSSWYAPCACS